MDREMPVYSIKTDEAALYRFQLYVGYRSFQGLSVIIISLLLTAYLIIGWSRLNTPVKVMLILLALYYIALRPLFLRLKVRLTARAAGFDTPVRFAFTDDGISVARGEETAEAEWGMVWKIVVTRKDIYIFTGKIYAYIIPKEQTGEGWKDIVALAEEKGCRIV